MFKLPEIAFDKIPFLKPETVEFHYGKHHKAYVDNLNKLLEGSPLKEASLEEIVLKSEGGMFNNAAQAWNHTFYWLGLGAPGTQPTGPLEAAIGAQFGGMAQLKEQFLKSATTLFGSGWTWLGHSPKSGQMEIINTSNADTPLKSGMKPLLVCDVWEHAYYIDYRNARAKYLEDYWKHVNWSFVSQNYERREPLSLTPLMRS